jgi:hypothetical protein
VTVDEAARVLGLSVDAIRKRVQREQIAYVKNAAGRVRIILDEDETLQDKRQDITGQPEFRDELIEELRDRIRSLERRLDEEQEARRRTDTILAQLARANEEQARTIRGLEAPQEPSESPEPRSDTSTPADAGEEAEEPSDALGGPGSGTARGSLWRRLFGG